MEIKNVDEHGNVIENIDWDLWKRVRMEEVQDEKGEVIDLISHCERISQAELDERALIEAENNLKSTDYIVIKFCEQFVGCQNYSEMMESIETYNTKYKNVISQRQKWRDDINRLTKE